MLTRLDVIIPPTEKLVSVSDMRNYLRVDDNSDDLIIEGFINSVTDIAQTYLNRALLTQTLQFTYAKTSIPHSYPNGYGGWQGSIMSPNFPNNINNNQWGLRLPRSPVQAVLSVSQGFFNQSPDVFLVPGQDYYVDTATNPARIFFLVNNTSVPDHISVQYVAGYGSINSITFAGTATATGTINLEVANANVSGNVAIGDTSQVVAAKLWKALNAVPGISAAMLTANSINLVGNAPTVALGSIPAGLAASAGQPVSAVPPAIVDAIKIGVAYMYQNLASPLATMPDYFYGFLHGYKAYQFS